MKGIEAFECKSELLERDSTHANPNSNHLNEIQSIRKGFEVFECEFELFEQDLTHWKANSNHSKGIRHIQNQRNSKHLNTKFEPLTSNSNYLN